MLCFINYSFIWREWIGLMQVFLEGQLASSLTVWVFDGLFSSPCDELTFRDTFCMGEKVLFGNINF